MYNTHMHNMSMYNDLSGYFFLNPLESVGPSDNQDYQLSRTLSEFIFMADVVGKNSSKNFTETIRFTPWLTVRKGSGQSQFTDSPL